MQTQQNQSQGEASRVPVDPLLLQSPFHSQQVLFVAVHEDDASLLAIQDNTWLRVLLTFDWKAHRPTAARYFQALWEFNTAAAQRRAESAADRDEPWSEDEEQARLRLMAERPTGGNSEAPIVHPTPLPPEFTPTVREDLLEPGVAPFRIAGREPKCFFAMSKAFIALHVMGKGASAEEVSRLLNLSPPFARACGFTIPQDGRYRQSDIPKLRKLEQFDQIMSDRGLWAEVKGRVVGQNIASGKVPLDQETIAHDTTHYYAYSAMDVIELPSPPEATTPVEGTQDEGHTSQSDPAAEVTAQGAPGEESEPAKKVKKPKRKSQSRTVKNCRCQQPDSCPHPFVQSDFGAGTIVKGSQSGGKRKYWAHKAGVFTVTPFGIPLDAVAMTDAASHDGTTLEPHLKRLLRLHPEVKKVKQIVADSAYDDKPTRQRVEEEHGIPVRTAVNPRSHKTQTDDLGRGMKSLSPVGTLTCQDDREMTYQGIRYETEHFLYGPPGQTKSTNACQDCPLRQGCCNQDNQAGRHVSVPFGRRQLHFPTDDNYTSPS